jgi:hypothetical protein
MRKRWSLALLIAVPSAVAAPKFYSDDPLMREPPPLVLEKVRPRKLSDVYDLFSHVFATPGEKQRLPSLIKAQDINTLGEVLDGSWYEARHGRRRMSISDLVAGPGSSTPPADGPWTVVSAKSEGITPGFLVQDVRGELFFIKFDPLGHAEMATAADVICSKLFYALGYHVPENYIVQFDRDRLQIKEGATIRDPRGQRRPLSSKDIGEILLRTYREPDGTHRATASRLIRGDILHSFRYYGTRKDDPNDVVPHEHRRSLRGLQVFSAWLGHDDSRAINTLDVLLAEGSLRYVKHYLIDFGSTLGSASTKANSPRSGFEQFFTWKSSAKEFFSLGMWVPAWSRIRYPDMPSVGRFTAQHFNPLTWTPEYPNPAFDNRLPDDEFWAARQVMMFTDDEIRAIVKTGSYSDLAAERYVADTIITRRDAIGRAYLSQPLSLDAVRIENGRIAFDDLAVRYKLHKAPVDYRYQWFSFDNQSQHKTVIPGASSPEIPARSASPYVALEVSAAGNERRRMTIYLRQANPGFSIVGIDRVLN